MAKIKFLTAAPDETSGINYNTPIRKFDTHPNLYFEIGARVMPLDWEEPPITGKVIGHVAEDRVIVDWGRVIDQCDVDDLVKMDEYLGQTARSRFPDRSGSRKAWGNMLGQPPAWGQDPRAVPQSNSPVGKSKQPWTREQLVKQHGAAYNPFRYEGIKNLLIQAGLSEYDVEVLAQDIENFKAHYKSKTQQDWSTGAKPQRFASQGSLKIVVAGIEDNPIYKANQKVIDKHRNEMGYTYNPLKIPALQKVLQNYGLHPEDIKAMANKTQALIDAHVKQNGQWNHGESLHPYDPYSAVQNASTPAQTNVPQAGDQVQSAPAGNTVTEQGGDPTDKMFIERLNQLIQVLQSKSNPESVAVMPRDYKYDFMKVVDQLMEGMGNPVAQTTPTPANRASSIQELSRVADLTEQAGNLEAAESFRAAAAISKSVQDLYQDPETREASRDPVARKALSGARDLVIETVDKLRSTQDSALRVAADLAELHFAVSALYPTQDQGA